MLRTVSEIRNWEPYLKHVIQPLTFYCMVILCSPMINNLIFWLCKHSYRVRNAFSLMFQCFNIQMTINKCLNQIYQMTHSVSLCETCATFLIDLIYPSNPLWQDNWIQFHSLWICYECTPTLTNIVSASFFFFFFFFFCPDNFVVPILFTCICCIIYFFLHTIYANVNIALDLKL